MRATARASAWATVHPRVGGRRQASADPNWWRRVLNGADRGSSNSVLATGFARERATRKISPVYSSIPRGQIGAEWLKHAVLGHPKCPQVTPVGSKFGSKDAPALATANSVHRNMETPI